jgi:hypothetical protein
MTRSWSCWLPAHIGTLNLSEYNQYEFTEITNMNSANCTQCLPVVTPITTRSDYLHNGGNKLHEERWNLEKRGPEGMNEVDQKPFDVGPIMILKETRQG